MTIIRSISPKDHKEWFRMRDILWPGEDKSLHDKEMAEYIQGGNEVVFVAEHPNKGLCGFIEVGMRSVAEGCESNPVAYIEGWYVDKDMRSMGIDKKRFDIIIQP